MGKFQFSITHSNTYKYTENARMKLYIERRHMMDFDLKNETADAKKLDQHF